MNEKLTPEQRDMIMDDVIVPFAGADTNWDGISEALDHITTHTEPEDEVLAECGRCGRTGFETDEEIAKRMIEACIEIYRKKYNTLYTTPTLGEVMNWLQREET